MDIPTAAPPLGLYKETRVNLELQSLNSIVQIQLSSSSTFARTTRLQRRVIITPAICKNEEDYKKRNVAGASSVYFRRPAKYPRSFLWRCLEDDTVLELRSVDVSKDEHEAREATLVLRIAFPRTIRRGGVALADSSEQDVLSVFVLTKSNEIHTLTLRPDFFCRPEASDDETGTWCHTFKPSSFSISTPHRLYASSALELLVSLADGRLVRLSRKAGEDGSKWQEAAYNDGQWGASIRGLLLWQGTTTVRYDDHTLDQDTVLAAQTSPDNKHLLAVSLNHSLKAWNIATGKPTFSRDLLDIPREPPEVPRIMIDPGISQLMQVFEAYGVRSGDRYYIATYSPQQSGLFKFWGIRDADFSDTGVRDLFPDQVLKVPDPDDGALWTMADFRIKATREFSEIEVWILVRLNRRYRLFSKKMDIKNLALDWEQDWTVTITEPSQQDLASERLAKISELDPEDPTEKWLEFVLSPGRVPETVLETALLVYNEDKDKTPLPSNLAKASLKERLATVIGSRIDTGAINGDAFKLREQKLRAWTHYWSIVCELDQSRWDFLSLEYDEHAESAWLTFADGCSVVRHCGTIERIAYNAPESLGNSTSQVVEDETVIPESADLATLIALAAKFRASFSEDLEYLCRNALQRELWQDNPHAISVRIQNFYEKCNLDKVTDQQYNDLMKGLEHLPELTTDLLMSLIRSFLQEMSTEASTLQSTTFGLKVLVRGAQEMVELHTRILTDLLCLVTFIDGETDTDLLLDDFDASQVFTELLDLLRKYQVLQWLATNSRQVPVNRRNSVSRRDSISQTGSPKKVITTVLENLFAVDTKPQSYTNKSQCETITGSIEDLLRWATGGNDPAITLNSALVSIQCDLLKHNNIDLASNFLLFQPSTSWATYIRGCLYLLRSEFTEAATYFTKAAYNLSRPSPHIDFTLASSYYITPIAATFLSSGLFRYYSHITYLFDAHRAYTHVIHFAQLALQFHIPPPTQDQQSDLLARLFQAALSISEFDIAYSALMRYTKKDLQHNALKRLVAEMLGKGYATELLALPFAGLKEDVDAILVDGVKREGDGSLTAAVAGGEVLPYYKLLYAWRIRQGDVRGAVSVLVERFEQRKKRGQRKRVGVLASKRGEKERDTVLEEYLVAINALELAGENEGWVLVGGSGGKFGQGEMRQDEKRKVVTLEDVRKGYQEELDRRSVLETGRFGIVGGLGEDDDDEDEMEE